MVALTLPCAALFGCATSTTSSPFAGTTSNDSNTIATGGSGGTLSNGGGLGSGAAGNTSGDGAARPERCNDAGVCTCFNIGSIGFGGKTGAQGTDTTTAFLSYLNSASSTGVAQVTTKPDLTDPTFLAQYDVLIFQWMATSLAPVTMMATSYGYTADTALGGGGYWTWTSGDLAALKTWVQNGGGVIVLSGFDYCPGNTGCTSGADDELGPTNQIVQALTDMSYSSTATFDTTETGNAEYCLGDSDPVTGWMPTPDLLGENITRVGAFYGRTINPGKGTVDCQNTQFGVCSAHEDVGMGHVYIYTDEWVTYTSQWNPAVQPAGYCSLDGSTANGDFPAVQASYQTPQFWYNAITYAAQHTMCPFTLPGVIPR